MKSNTFDAAGALVLTFGIVAGIAVMGLESASAGISIICASVVAFFVLRFFASALFHLEIIADRLNGLAPKKEEPKIQLPPPKVPQMPPRDGGARKDAVAAINATGYKATDKIKTPEDYSVSIDNVHKQFAIIQPDGRYALHGYTDYQGCEMREDRSGDFIYGVEAVVRAGGEEYHVVTLDNTMLDAKTAESAQEEARRIVRLLNKISVPAVN